jgi:hypothetical protein
LILSKISQIWRPEAYHGDGKKGPFFQGWFYKLVDHSKQHTLALIPGILISPEKDKSHAFIQILENRSHRSFNIRFPLREFRASENHLEITIGENVFSAQSINLNLQSDDLEIKGNIVFNKFLPWPVKLFSPGIMGWYAFVPLMQCYHAVLSMNHSLQGEVTLNGHHILFNGGKGYVENDWGRSFPEAYIWMQANHFDTEGVSLTASIAKIPWLRSAFRGFIIGLFWDGKLYRFTTYTGAKLTQVTVKGCEISFSVNSSRYELRVKAVTGKQGHLDAPGDSQLLTRVSESLDSEIFLELYEKVGKNNYLKFKDHATPAAAEANGNLQLILD